LKYYQNTIRAYCDHIDSSANGLLAYLGMGMGKSILAASIAVDMLLRGETGFEGKHIRGKRKANRCIFILTKSLAENMRQAIRKYFELRRRALGAGDSLHNVDVEKFIAEKFTFVSMNASNMITQFIRAAAGKGLSGQLSKEDSIPGKILLSDTLVIVDEAHNLFRGITNGSKNALGFYKTMESSLKKRDHGNYMLFLTGTPINNNPFELVSCFNMLAGDDILPIDYDEFREAFVNTGGSRTIKNEAHFMDRILGLVAYATHETTPGKAIREGADTSTGIEFPTDLGIKVMLCNMSPEQYSLYLIAREAESAENAGKTSRGKVIIKKMQLPKSNMTSSYRTKSRQLSNFFENNLENKDPSKINNAWSPKYEAILKNVEKHNTDIGTLGLVYSQYVGIGGLGSFAEFLKMNGWKEYSLTYDETRIETDVIEREEPEELTEDDAPQETNDIVHHMPTDTEDAESNQQPQPTISAEDVPLNITGSGGRRSNLSHNLTQSKLSDMPPSRRESSLSEYMREMSGTNIRKMPNVKEISISPRVQKIFAGLEENDSFESLRSRDPYAYTPVNTRPYKRIGKNKAIKKGGDVNEDYASLYSSGDDGSDFDTEYYGGSFMTEDEEEQILTQDALDEEINANQSLFSGGHVNGGSKFYDESSRQIPIKASRTFAVIKGGLSDESRKRIESLMQSPDNRHGEIVSLVLVSSVGAEGLDFKAIRHIHILEPYWNYARLAQIQFRGIRNDSHKSLPMAEKNVQTYIYCAIPPASIGMTEVAETIELSDFEKMHLKDIHDITVTHAKNITLPDTTDINLLFEAVKNYRIIESFLGPIQRSSITAGIDALTNARLCAPTNKILYTKNIGADLKMPDSCKPFRTKKITVNTIHLANGDEYFYVEDDTSAFGYKVFDKNHKEVTKNNSIFMTVITQLTTEDLISLD